jgi:hypothetical protein
MKKTFPQKNILLCIMLFFFCLALNSAAGEKETQNTSGDQSPVVRTESGDVNITYEGLSEELKELLSNELNNNRKLIDKLLEKLNEEDVAIEDYKVKMNQWVERYKELEQRVKQIEGQNKLISQAKVELDDFDLEGVESLLVQNMTDDLKKNVVSIKASFGEKESAIQRGFGFIIGKKGDKACIVTTKHVVWRKNFKPDKQANDIEVSYFSSQKNSVKAELCKTYFGRYHIQVLTAKLPHQVKWVPKLLDEVKEIASNAKDRLIGRDEEWYVPTPSDNIVGKTKHDEFEFRKLKDLRSCLGAPVVSKNGVLGIIVEDTSGGVTVISIEAVKAEIISRCSDCWDLHHGVAVIPVVGTVGGVVVVSAAAAVNYIGGKSDEEPNSDPPENNIMGQWDYSFYNPEINDEEAVGTISFSGSYTNGTFSRINRVNNQTYYGTYTVDGSKVTILGSVYRLNGFFETKEELKGTWQKLSEPTVEGTWQICKD